MREKIRALGRVVMTTGLVAYSANWNGLNERIARQEVKHVPDQVGRPEEVARVRLAPGLDRPLIHTPLSVVGKQEEVDVGELEVG